MSNALPRVLVVDDEKNIRRSLRLCLESAGAAVVDAASAAEALAPPTATRSTSASSTSASGRTTAST